MVSGEIDRCVKCKERLSLCKTRGTALERVLRAFDVAAAVISPFILDVELCHNRNDYYRSTCTVHRKVYQGVASTQWDDNMTIHTGSPAGSSAQRHGLDRILMTVKPTQHVSTTTPPWNVTILVIRMKYP